MTKKDEIRQLLAQGESKAELVRRGYARGSVYGAARGMVKPVNPNPARSSTNGAVPSPASTPLAMIPSTDPEISQLQKEIQRARLEAELKKVRGDVKSVEELEQEVARLRAWTVAIVRSLGEAIEHLAGHDIDAASFEAFEREALQELERTSRNT